MKRTRGTRAAVSLLALLAFAVFAAVGGREPSTRTAASSSGDAVPGAHASAAERRATARIASKALSSYRAPTKPSKVPSIVDQFALQVGAVVADGRSPETLSNSILHVTRDGKIELNFWARAAVRPSDERSLERLGASIVAKVSKPSLRGRPVGVVQARVPYARVHEAAALSWVAAVAAPEYGAVDIGPIVSQGVALHNANTVQSPRNINGTGVNVGVISNGVSNLAASQAAGELPAGVNVLNTGSGDEGTAMLEIVSDMAPGAGLLFNGSGGTVATHVNALNNLVSNGANVITEDIPFDAEPAFQQGLATQTAENIAAAGVSVHSSAGNLGQQHSARVTAVGTAAGPDGSSGPYSGCANTPDNVVAIAPSNDTTFDVNVSNGDTITLQWSEPRAIFPSAGQGGFTDLNLYLMNSTLTSCLAQSTTAQANGVGDTIEQISYSGSAQAAKIVVDVQGTSSAAAPPTLDLRFRGSGAIDTPTRAGSLNPDSNYTGQATSAAALDAQNSGAIESYSGGGPVQLMTTTQCPGGGAGPCTGVAGPATQTATAPTWGAADDVSVSGVGGFGSPFSGTSAAAPHAAACDALLRDALNNASASPATTNARLIATAADIAPAGVDNVTGAGQLDCLQAVNNPPAANAGGPYTTDEGTDVALNGGASSDPDVGDSIAAYSWDLDNNGTFGDATGPTPNFTAVGQDGVYTIKLRVTDQAGVTNVASTTVTVNNVAPSVTVGSDSPKAENTAATVSGVVSDPGWLDPLTATVDWGDGAGAVALAGTLENVRPDATLTYSAAHTYGDNGAFTVKVCGSDDDTSTCQTTLVTVTNTAPTAVIDTTGATVVNGTPTFLAHAGQALTFKGGSKDPGSDDELLTWDWGDGGASPDASTSYLVNPPFADPFPSPSIQPRNLVDTQVHAFGAACLYSIAFAARDDDTGAASQSANVIIAGNATESRGAGYWQNQYRPRPGVFSDSVRACYLAIAGYMSQVFNEARDASTFPAAYDVIFVAGNGGSATQQLDRQLLTGWLNFANGAFNYGQLVDTNGDAVPDMPFSLVMTTAEAVRLSGSSTAAQLRAQKDRLERMNGN